MSYAGIAQATGTRLDSAAKHTMACKLDDNMHIGWFAETTNARTHIQSNKYLYAMQKDELVLNVTQKLLATASSGSASGAKAYPAVVTSTGSMPWEVKIGLRNLYSSKTGEEFLCKREFANSMDHAETATVGAKKSAVFKRIWDSMPFFTAQGYALGTAWASPHSGDTVGTVLVGGMVSVRNGAFACRSGQPIMFYFDFEETEFSPTTSSEAFEGERFDLVVDIEKEETVLEKTKKRSEEAGGTTAGRKRSRMVEYDSYGGSMLKNGIALPKPYVMQRGSEHYGDRIRVFAKCINGGRPHDMIDLMLMTQSL